jgi:hypothetical protein
VNGDAKAVTAAADPFFKAYPEIDMLFFDAQGRFVTAIGCENPEKSLGEIPLAKGVKEGEFRGLLSHGCQSDKTAVPAYAIGEHLAGGGTIVLCLPINEAYLTNSATKLELELALVRGEPEVVVETTKNFPKTSVTLAEKVPQIASENGITYAVGEFEIKQFAGASENFRIVAAMNVTRIRATVWHNLDFAVGAVILAGIIALVFGIRVASIMSRALSRVNSKTWLRASIRWSTGYKSETSCATRSAST